MALLYISVSVLTFIILTTLLLLNISFDQAAVITFPIVMSIYIIAIIIYNKRLRYFLDEACDPEEYLIRILKLKRTMKRKPRSMAMLTINEAVAYLLMGRFEEAKSLLEEVDKSFLSEKNGTLLIYTIDYIICCFELGEIEEAEELFGSQIPILAIPSKRLKSSINILVGERYFFIGKYDQSYEHLNKLLDIELSRRQHLSILDRLAQIDSIRGDFDLAQKKYKKIAQYGNKLWIAAQAKKHLEV